MGRRRTAPVAVLVLTALVAGCNAGDNGVEDDARVPTVDEAPAGSPSPATSDEPAAEPAVEPALLVEPAAATTVLAEDGAQALAVAASRTLFESAPLVVLAPVDDRQAQERAARASVAAGMPLLLVAPETSPDIPPGGAAATDAPAGTASPPASPRPPAPPDPAVAELERLGATTVLTFGTVPGGYADVSTVPAPGQDTGLALLLDVPVAEVQGGDPVTVTSGLVPGELASPDVPEAAPAPDDELPLTSPGEPAGEVLVLSTGAAEQLAAVATARAARADVLLVPGGDPRAGSTTVQALAGRGGVGTTVALGTTFGDAATLDWRLSTAVTGTELPGGGQLVLPGTTYVALYGSPITASLGVLGEQGPEATVRRAQEHASWYTDLTDTTVVPALEVIATVAAGDAGADGNYSNEWPLEDLRPLVDLAGENGQYVVLDLQPGRTDFLTQATQYEELLREPHVGLALDPEWRLRPDQQHLRQIGQVDVAEVNEVVTWLADLTRDHELPQKLLVLHQFQVRMIPGLDSVDQSRSELAVLVHVDGQGSQPAKQDTWRVLRRNAPSITWWGWKNFYDEDAPMLTPEQTMQVEPRPSFISYQ